MGSLALPCENTDEGLVWPAFVFAKENKGLDLKGMTGYEVLEQLQQDPSTANIPCVFLSAKSIDKDIRLGIKLGSDSYLTKPIIKSELLAEVNSRLASVDSQSMSQPVASTSILDRVRWIYQNVVTEKLGSRYSGWTVAIEPDSGRCFVGHDLPSAHDKAHRSLPGRVFYYQKIYPKHQSPSERFCDLANNLPQVNPQARSQHSRELCLTA
ncbi:MAG: PleD family two-component system response regulator [Cyanophyceae cyanobacterium]